MLKPGTGETVKAVSILSDQSHTAHKLVVAPERVLETGDTVYLRLTLGGGMVFAKDAITGLATSGIWEFGPYPAEPTSIMCDADGDAETDPTEVDTTTEFAATTIEASHSSGAGKGNAYAVFRMTIPATGIPLTGGAFDHAEDDCDRDAVGTKIWVDIFQSATDGGYLAIPAGPGSYTAAISMHSDADEAQAGTNPSSAVAGSAVIVRAMNALDVEVMANLAPAVAQVNSTPEPFLWFAGGATNADLGHAKAEIGVAGLINPKTGMTAQDSELIDPGSLTLRVEGNFAIGAFHLSDPAACPPVGRASASEPSAGNLVADDDLPANVRMLTGQNAGNYRLCVEVNTRGAENLKPIPPEKYRATITQGQGALAQELASGVIGEIKRNGASINVAYLTVADKYNQRLIIVNNGSSPARYDVGSWVTEDGTVATPLAKASGMIDAGAQLVIPVKEIVSLTSGDGRRLRAAATVTLNADADDVQVATTQVALEAGGGTDTVVYDSKGT